jgi:tRNA A37 N6-isopentenylltransferase MiaA
VTTIALRTRQLSKRQETWFRKVEGVDWFDLESPEQFPGIAESIAGRSDP